MNIQKIVTICLTLAMVIGIGHTVLAQSTKDIRSAGDVLQIGIPLAAYGMTYLFDDPQGRRSFTTTLLSTMGTTYALKYSVPRERPEGSDTLSFVSGHTSAAFSGATFIQRRYGWKYGIPAYLAASFVGWSRVKSGKHYSDDVLRGAALGMLSAYTFTKSYKGPIRIMPMVNNQGIGLAFQGTW